MTPIQPITESDLPDVLAMIHALAVHHGDVAMVTPEDLRRDALGPHPWLHVLVAKGSGYCALHGQAQLHFGVRGMEVHHLYVHPAQRGAGIGRALMQAAQAYAQGLGCRYLTVGTHVDNTAAQAMYRAIGFDRLDREGPRFRVKW